jgi:hypothetical protein
MNVRLFDCPVGGGCVAPPGLERSGEERGLFLQTGPRVCSHFRADGTRIYCSYAREEIPYRHEGPLGKSETPAVAAPPARSTGTGFWSSSYVSRKRRAHTGPRPRPRPPGDAPPTHAGEAHADMSSAPEGAPIACGP